MHIPLNHYYGLLYVNLHTVQTATNETVKQWYICFHFASQTRTVHHQIKRHDSEWPFAYLQSTVYQKFALKKKNIYIILILTLTSSKASAKQIVFHFLLFWWMMANGCQKLLRYNSGFQDTKSSSLTHQSRRVLHLGRSQSHTHTKSRHNTHTPIKINEKLGYFRDGVFMTAINNKRCPHNVDKGEWLH